MKGTAYLISKTFDLRKKQQCNRKYTKVKMYALCYIIRVKFVLTNKTQYN